MSSRAAVISPSMDLKSKEWSVRRNATAVEILELGARIRQNHHTISVPAQASKSSNDMPTNEFFTNVATIPMDQRNHTHHPNTTYRRQATAATGSLNLLSNQHVVVKRTVALSIVIGIYLFLGNILCSLPSLSCNLLWQGLTCSNGTFGGFQLWDRTGNCTVATNLSLHAVGVTNIDGTPDSRTPHDLLSEEVGITIDYAMINERVDELKSIGELVNELNLLALFLTLPSDDLASTSEKFHETAFNITQTDLENKWQISLDHQDLANRTSEVCLCSTAIRIKVFQIQAKSTLTYLQGILVSLEDFSDSTQPEPNRLRNIIVSHIHSINTLLAALEEDATNCRSHTEEIREGLERISTSLEQGRRIVQARLSKWNVNPFLFYAREQRQLLASLPSNYTLPHEEHFVVIEAVVAKAVPIRQRTSKLLDTLEGDHGLPLTMAILDEIMG